MVNTPHLCRRASLRLVVPWPWLPVWCLLSTTSAFAANESSAWQPTYWYAQAGQAPRTDTSSLVVGAIWPWAWRWSVADGTLCGYWETGVGRWSSRVNGTREGAWVTQWSLTPVLRWQPREAAPWFVEAAIGLHVITPLYRGGSRQFSTAFNFGDHLAVGWHWPDQRLRELSLRVQHFSNAGLRRPNPGEDFVQLRVVWVL